MDLHGKTTLFLGLWLAILTTGSFGSPHHKNHTGKRPFNWLYKVPDYKATWAYDGDLAPEYWCKKYPSCCTRRQSPVEVGSGQTHPYASNWEALQFRGYDHQPDSFLLENNGHTVNVYLTGAAGAGVDGGGLNGSYIFHSLHFHWGKDDADGAEHSIYGTKFPLEMHVVHYKSGYKDLNEARFSKNPDAVAVLGVLFHLSSHENAALGAITRDLRHITFPDHRHPIKHTFQLKDLLPNNTDAFYRYLGSFTTPGCEEVVAWTVFKWSLPVTPTQLAAFRSIYEEDRGTLFRLALVDNFRPVQPLYGRSVYDVTAVQVGEPPSAASAR